MGSALTNAGKRLVPAICVSDQVVLGIHMSGPHSLTRTFATLENAEAAVERLVRAGLARNTIALKPLPDADVNLSMHVSKRNRDRVEALLDGVEWQGSVNGATRLAERVAEKPFSALLLARGAGYVFARVLRR